MNVTVKCAKETYELGHGVAGFIEATKKALADGWQTGEDLPVIITAAVSSLVPSFQGVEKIKDEFVNTPVEAAMSIAVGLGECVSAVIKK